MPTTKADKADEAIDRAELRINNVAVNGKAWHLMKLAEECGELAAVIMQYFTKDGCMSEIIAEAADVEIALEHFRIIAESFLPGDMEAYKKSKDMAIVEAMDENARAGKTMNNGLVLRVLGGR